jgi:hypothetical protein
MPEQKIAVIHAGFHKTGSSSIQHTLAGNRNLLMRNGWVYPEFSIDGKMLFNKSISLHGYYCEKPEQFKHYWHHSKIHHEVANTKISALLKGNIWKLPKLVFSDEFVSTLSQKALATLRSDFVDHGYMIKVVSFVREPLQLATSSTQQRARSVSIEASLKRHKPTDTLEKIDKLSELFGSEAVFYNFEKACKHRAGPAGFFFELLGIDIEPDQTALVNQGMSLQAVRVLNHINARVAKFESETSINPLRSRQDDAEISKIPGQKFQLTREQISQIKPDADYARTEIERRLGADFFLPEKIPGEDPIFQWEDAQFDFLERVFGRLDLHILISVCHFLIELQNTQAIDKDRTQRFLSLARRRIDRENALSSRKVSALLARLLGKLISKTRAWQP